MDNVKFDYSYSSEKGTCMQVENSELKVVNSIFTNFNNTAIQIIGEGNTVFENSLFKFGGAPEALGGAINFDESFNTDI